MELELKFACDNHSLLREKAVTLGFERVKEKHQRDTYFIVGERNDTGSRVYLRLREDLLRQEASIDYHVVLSELETNETEVAIEHPADDKALLEALGFNTVCVVDKQRTEYARENVTLTFDTVENLGSFVEVEIEGDSSDENKALLQSVAGELDLQESARVSKKGYPDLLLEQQRM